MGQGQSCSIKFKDNYTASDVNGRGRIKSKKSCSFTQVSKDGFSIDRETSISCKVYESNYDRVAFGLVPKESVDGCCRNLLGDREIYGSVGCHVTRDSVALVKGDRSFFQGSYEAGRAFTITMRIRHGTLSFLVDGRKVNSEELEAMDFNGHYKLGVSMISAGQEAEVYFDCPVTFADTWRAGDVQHDILSVKYSTNFTFYSEQVISPRGQHKIVANVLRNECNSVGLGVVPVDCKSLCQSNLVGMKSGMIGCIFKGGQIFVVINGDVVFASNVNTADPCVLAMTLDRGRISFAFDGRKVDCEKLEKVRLSEDFRIGLGMSAEGQLVEMRGDGNVLHSTSSAADDLLKQLVDLLVDAGLGSESSSSNDLSWRDNMRSIDCDRSDQVAVCVKKFTATLYSKCVVSANSQNSIDIRILALKPGQLMVIGVMDKDPKNHSDHHVGAAEMNNSLGLTSRGDLLMGGSTKASGRSFRQGDLVSLAFNNGDLSIKVNGVEAVPELGRFDFKSQFRWAVSFTDVGQAVKIGRDSLTSDETLFCRSKGVDPNGSPSKSAYGTSITVNSTINTSDVSSLKSSSASTAKSYDDSIMGCYIDVDDITYGGRPLGEGSFGAVFKGKWDGSDVAVKKLPWEEDDNQRREIAVGRSLTHPNIASITGWSREGNNLLVVMPLFRKGSLADCISRVDRSAEPTPSTGGHFGFEFTFNIALGLLRAIKYMAARKPNPMIHRDIKPANVLLDDQDKPMLTDFGTARSVQRSVVGTLTMCGTPMYMAPEQAKHGAASPATDVYAATLIIYEVLCAPRSVRTSTIMYELMQEIVEGKVPPMHDVPREIARLLEPAFSADPANRPTASQMISSFEGVTAMYGSAYSSAYSS